MFSQGDIYHVSEKWAPYMLSKQLKSCSHSALRAKSLYIYIHTVTRHFLVVVQYILHVHNRQHIYIYVVEHFAELLMGVY